MTTTGVVVVVVVRVGVVAVFAAAASAAAALLLLWFIRHLCFSLSSSSYFVTCVLTSHNFTKISPYS